MTTRKPKPRTSGATIPEAERAARGQGRLTLRLPVDVLAILAAESERSGYTRAELVATAIRLHCVPGAPAPSRARAPTKRPHALPR
jgi:hypothetical protein